MAQQKKSWKDLTPTQQRVVVVVGALEAVLTSVALRDLAKRPADEVRGPKWLWTAACAVQPFGPVAYLLRGRRRR